MRANKQEPKRPIFELGAGEGGPKPDIPEAKGCSWKSCNDPNCAKPWHRQFVKTNVVQKLQPVITVLGGAEGLVGIVLVTVLANYSAGFDHLYGCEYPRLCFITYLTYCGLIALSISGIVLLASMLMNQRAIMWFYVIMSTALCVFIFILAVIMIQYALYNAPVLKPYDQHQLIDVDIPGNSGKETNETTTHAPCKLGETHILLGKACIIGILTLLGSVMHFIGTVTVFTYYNLKYTYPMMFLCHQEAEAIL